MSCRIRLYNSGRPAPRTCAECALGPCRFGAVLGGGELQRLAPKPEIVTLCGSTRFRESFFAEQRRLTLEGRIVISVGIFGHLEGLDVGTAESPTPLKEMLDLLHFRKIDLSDRIHVINEGGYVGSSTRNEIAYARERKIPVTFMEEAR